VVTLPTEPPDELWPLEEEPVEDDPDPVEPVEDDPEEPVDTEPDPDTVVVTAALRASAGSCPETSTTAINSHVATNRATAPAMTRLRIIRTRALRANLISLGEFMRTASPPPVSVV
jgi:hypothetical protein